MSSAGFCSAAASARFRDRGEPLARSGRGETEEKKNESTHCNNCSGSIIPTLEQIRLMCVSMWLGRKGAAECSADMDMIPSDACANSSSVY